MISSTSSATPAAASTSIIVPFLPYACNSFLIILFSLSSTTAAQCYWAKYDYKRMSAVYLIHSMTECLFILKQLSHYRQAAETAQTDLAAEKVVSSGLQRDVCVQPEFLNSFSYMIINFHLIGTI